MTCKQLNNNGSVIYVVNLWGIVVALALIAEAIAFSILAGVDPMVGVCVSFIIAVVVAFAGGRPECFRSYCCNGFLMVPLFVIMVLAFAATILTGVIQILFGIFKVAKVMKFMPNAVMIGFVNALAILIFMAQLDALLVFQQ